jgi:ribonuclease E
VPYVARLHAEGALPPPDRTTDERTDRPVPSEPPALAAAAGEEGERKRRRRGRRGGRGRRRPGAEGAPPQDGGHDAVA